MSGVRHAPNLGPYVSTPGASTSQAQLQNVMYSAVSSSETEMTDLATGLKNKAQTTKGLNQRQMAAYDKQMLAAVKDIKPPSLPNADKLTAAAVVPGALGVLQPSGPDQAGASSPGQMANLELQGALQKQQQAMQMMSNIMKAQHDTASAIIRNLR